MSVFDGPSRIPLSPFRPPPLSPRTLGPFSASPHTLMEEKSLELAKRRIPPSLPPSLLQNPPLSSGNDCQGDMELLSNASARASPHAHMYPIKENDWHKKKQQVQIVLFYHEEVKKNYRPMFARGIHCRTLYRSTFCSPIYSPPSAFSLRIQFSRLWGKRFSTPGRLGWARRRNSKRAISKFP